MLSGGEAIESYAVRRRRRLLRALANACRRWPIGAGIAHLEDVPLDPIAVGDAVVVFPHEICPVDGEVIEGHGVMDESYLDRRAVSDVEDARRQGALRVDQRRDGPDDSRHAARRRFAYAKSCR